jgi:hypothetical protein
MISRHETHMCAMIRGSAAARDKPDAAIERGSRARHLTL